MCESNQIFFVLRFDAFTFSRLEMVVTLIEKSI